jgi:hypothetical protein
VQELLDFFRAAPAARRAIADDGDQDGGFEDATWLNDPDSPFTKFGDAATAMIRTFAVPRRVLAEVDAKRRILEWLTPVDRTGMAGVLLRTLALPYASHTDFCAEWKLA